MSSGVELPDLVRVASEYRECSECHPEFLAELHRLRASFADSSAFFRWLLSIGIGVELSRN